MSGPTNARAARLAPAALETSHYWPANPTAANPAAQRLPAYGRRLRDAIEAGFLPETGGGSVLVVTDWDAATAFDPGRLVCTPDVPADAYRFEFLAGTEVGIIVPSALRGYGEALRARILEAGATLVALVVNPEGRP